MNGAYAPPPAAPPALQGVLPPLDCFSGGIEGANGGPLWYNQQDKNYSERAANMMTKVLFVCHGMISTDPQKSL